MVTSFDNLPYLDRNAMMDRYDLHMNKYGHYSVKKIAEMRAARAATPSKTLATPKSNKTQMLESNKPEKSNTLSNKSNTESNNTFDKKAYMKEYMAKKRAEKD